MSMDRKIEKKRYTMSRILTIAGLVLAVGMVFWLFQGPGFRDTFRVDRSRITISTVTSGEFEDFIPIRGRVTPLKSVYLDAIEGGRVEALLVEEGTYVTVGQPLLELSNTSLSNSKATWSISTTTSSASTAWWSDAATSTNRN